MSKIKINDRVMFAAKFLRSTGQFTGDSAPTSCGPFARGLVIALTQISGKTNYCRVRWDDGRETGALACNLAVEK